jgi:fumarate hydratase subunit beta
MKKVQLPLTEETIRGLKAGDQVLLSGTVLTGRDAAHKRLLALMDQGQELPINLAGQTIYYVGPAPARPGQAVGPAGPTSSYRMDKYTPPLLDLGLKGMIGKGRIGPETLKVMPAHGAVYFGAIGGSAVIISKSIKSARVVAYPDLGPEAIHEFVIEDFPAVVCVDAQGNNLYEEGPKLYKQDEL